MHSHNNMSEMCVCALLDIDSTLIIHYARIVNKVNA